MRCRDGKRAAIASGGGFEADGVGLFNPFFDTHLVAVQSGLASNYGEFAVIKIRVEDRFPDAEKFHRIPVAQPVGDEELAVLCSEHVSEGNVIALLASEDGYDRSADFNCGGFRFLHGKYWRGHFTIGFHTFRKPRPSKSFTFAVANSVTPCAVMVRAERVS